MSTAIRVLAIVAMLTLTVASAVLAAAAEEDRMRGASGETMLATTPDQPTVPTVAQATDEQSAELDTEQSKDRTGWEVAAVAIFLGISALGFVVAVYGYSEGK